MAQPFNAEALRMEREAFPIADGVGLVPTRDWGLSPSQLTECWRIVPVEDS